MLRGNAALVKLDIDSPTLPLLDEMVRKVRRAGYRRIEWLSQRRSPGGQGWHVVLKVCPNPSSELEIVALQAILGSDLFREACNLHRVKMLPSVPPYWRKRWNVLYRKAGDA